MGTEKSIGTATMKADGTVILQLRAEGKNNIIGDALLEYKPSDKNYKKIIDHIGGLKKGETKSVPSWPDD